MTLLERLQRIQGSGVIAPLPTLEPQPLDIPEFNGELPGLRKNLSMKDLLMELRGSDKLSGLSEGAGGLGSIMSQLSINEEGQDNSGLAIGGGALQGISAGASLGPLGSILGGLLGGASGLARSSQATADFYDTKALEDKFKLSGKTVGPSRFAKGGFATSTEEGQELVQVQMELDETYVTPDLEILDSKATMKHEDMEDSEITDVVKTQSFAFSNRKDFKASTVADEVLGYGFAYYNEDGTHELEKVLMSDVFGDSKKPKTYAKAITDVRRKYKTVRADDKSSDVFTRITNDENRQARTPFVNSLIKLHQGGSIKTDSPALPQKFGKGGEMLYLAGGGPISEYDKLLAELEQLDGQNQTTFDANQEAAGNLFNRSNARNGLSSILSGLSTGMQSTRVDPNLQGTSLADEMFRGTSPAFADQLSSNNFARVNSLVANGGEAGAKLAPRLFDSALNQSNRSALSINASNDKQRRARYSFLNSTNNANSAERIRADEATRDLINKKRRALGNVGVNYLSNSNALDVNEFQYGQANQLQFNNNTQALLQNRLGVNSNKANFMLQRDALRNIESLRQTSLERQRKAELEQAMMNDPKMKGALDFGEGVFSQPNNFNDLYNGTLT